MEGITFDAAVQVFVTYCKAKALADRTVQTYTSSLKKLRGFLATADEEPEIPSSVQIRGYIVHLLGAGLAKTSVGIHMRSIRCFCNFLVREDLVATSPMKNVEIPKAPNRYPEILSVDQVRRLVRAARQPAWTGIRNYAMLLTFLDTGIRLGELVALELEDVNLRDLSIRIRKGKGDKERYIFMGRKLFQAIRGWLNVRGIATPEKAFYASRKGSRLDLRNVERIIERLAMKAGLQEIRVTPHILRHTMATMYIVNGGDPFSLQRILGHSSISTTQIYVNLAGVGLREAHAKASPVDRLFDSSR